MANIDKKLKIIAVGAFLWLLVIVYILTYLHFSAENKQAQRELEYLKAHQRPACGATAPGASPAVGAHHAAATPGAGVQPGAHYRSGRESGAINTFRPQRVPGSKL